MKRQHFVHVYLSFWGPPASLSHAVHAALPTASAVPRTPVRKQPNYSTTIHTTTKVLLLTSFSAPLRVFPQLQEVTTFQKPTLNLLYTCCYFYVMSAQKDACALLIFHCLETSSQIFLKHHKKSVTSTCNILPKT